MKTFGAEKRLTQRRWPELSEAEERLYDLMVPENERNAIQLDDFADLYGDETVSRDKARVAELEEKFRQEQSDPESQDLAKRGKLFEAIVGDQIDSSNWLGPNASVIVPSRYDDIENGVDSIVEFELEGGRSHLALAIDVTKSGKQIDKKLAAVAASIRNGQLSRVKYFKSHDVRGEIREVPRVVVGAGEETMQDVAELLLLFKVRQQHPTAGKPGEFKEARARLENHRLQFQLLFEIRKQLESFLEYANSIKKPAVARKYEETLAIISKIIDEKNETTNYSEDSKELEDSVYYDIMHKAGYFQKQGPETGQAKQAIG